MKVERWALSKGENILFYIPDDGATPTTVTARCYTAHEGKMECTLKLLEEGIFALEILLNCIGKNVVIFSEDSVKKVIVIITVT